MKQEKAIVVIESKEKNNKDIKDILKEIVEENIRMYLSKNSFSND